MPLYNPGTIQPVTYRFVDGASLDGSLADLAARYLDGAPLPISWPRFASGARKTFYYDAIPVQAPGESETDHAARIAPKRAALDLIERQPAFHVRTGDVRRRRRVGNEQKMVDVHLAVDALSMASRGLFSSAVLVTSDLDFKPLVTALVELGIDVELQYQAGHANPELAAAADRATPIDVNLVRGWVRDVDAALLPVASYDFREPREAAPPDASLRWRDDGYGECFASPHPHGVRLSTERAPDDLTHRLTAVARDLGKLRHFCADCFGLAVP